jgi:hypothetical protein
MGTKSEVPNDPAVAHRTLHRASRLHGNHTHDLFDRRYSLNDFVQGNSLHAFYAQASHIIAELVDFCPFARTASLMVSSNGTIS